MGWQIPICQKGRRPLKKVCLTAFAESEFSNPFSFAESESGYGLANSDLPKRSETFKKVCLTAFAESEFGNPLYSGRSPIMGWQIPICQKGRRPLKKVCLTAFAESEFGNPLYF